MATSQNGWPVYTSGSHPDLVAIPKIIGRVRRGDVAKILTYLVTRFDREVEDVDAGADDWGYAYRAIRGKTSGYSNHASATALDLNATRHPLGKVGTFTASQVAAIRRILASLGGVVRWGGDYSGRKDEMHFEINAGPARVAQVAAALGSLVDNVISGGGSVTIPNTPGAPAPITPEDDMQADEREALFQIRDVLGARGGLNTPADDSVLGRVRNIDRQVTGANGFKGSVAEKVNGLAGGLPAIAGNVLALIARETAQTELIRQLGEGGDVDYDRIDRNTRAAVADGVAEVVAAIEGGIEADVTVTVNTPTTKG